MSNYWLIEELLAAENENQEWDTWNVGIAEGPDFRTIYSCTSRPDAERCITAMQTLEMMEESVERGVWPAHKPVACKAKVRKRATAKKR